MAGGRGDDTYIIDNRHDTVTEAAGRAGGIDLVKSSVSYTLGARVENLALTGSKALAGTGNGLANILDGGAGRDVLTGGAGNDSFLFDSRFAAANVDTVTDFTSGSDHIELDHSLFTALGRAAHLAASAFSDDGIAHTSAEHILYDPDNGVLTYDSNGKAAGGAHHFATLDAGLHLSAADFLIVA